jgi:hypothetical protein
MSDEGQSRDGRPQRRTVRGYHKPELGGKEDDMAQSSDDLEVDAPEANGPLPGAAAAPKGAPVAPAVQIKSASGEAELDPTKPYTRTPLVEIEVVHRHGPAPRSERPWKTLEVWTRNRVYTMDPAMTCVEVIDRITNKPVPDHAFLGSRLVGGQHREGQRIELSCPFPRPGTEAVFEHPTGQRGNFSRTSTVTRVVLRLHVVTVAPGHVVPTWETITGSMPAVSRGDE